MADTLQTVVEDMQNKISKLKDDIVPKSMIEILSDHLSAEILSEFSQRLQKIQAEDENAACPHHWQELHSVRIDELTDAVTYWCVKCGSLKHTCQYDLRIIPGSTRMQAPGGK